MATAVITGTNRGITVLAFHPGRVQTDMGGRTRW